jgi:hypothetical protein
VHHWVWQATVALRSALPPEKIKNLLTVATKGCGRDCERDIQDAANKVTQDRPNVAYYKQSAQARTPRGEPNLRKIEVNDALRRNIVEQGRTVPDLIASSPTKLPACEREVTTFLLDRLFPGNPLLCVATTINDHVTLRKCELTKPYLCSHIVPNPMSKAWGINREGKESQRCLDNTGLRQYLVIEFDLPVKAEDADSLDREFLKWADKAGKTVQDISVALLLHLAKAAPLVAVVDSANKSLHGWFNIQGWVDRHVLLFMGLAVRLGADPATYTRCQLVRMPGGVRYNEEGDPLWFQDVIYFDESRCARVSEVTRNG